MVDEVTVRGLLALGGAVVMFGVPLTWMKWLDHRDQKRARKAPTYHSLAGIEWRDSMFAPERRQN